MLTDRAMEQMLNGAGEQWRAARPRTTELASAESLVRDLHQHPIAARGTRRGAAAAVAGVAVVAASVVLAVVLRSGHGSPTAGSDAMQFRLQLHLDTTRVRADGHRIRGYVQVVNNTGKPIVIHYACDGWLGVGLTSAHIHYDFATEYVGCADRQLAVGTTTVKIAIATRYEQCQQETTPTVDPNDPTCLSGRRNMLPPLPPGSYEAVVRTANLGQQPSLPKPITVILTST